MISDHSNPSRPSAWTAHSVDRLPPHAAQAEQAVLGAVLAQTSPGNAALCQIQERLAGAQPFFLLPHAEIFAAMSLLHAEGKTVEMVCLAQRLRDSGRLDQVGGPAYLSSLADRAVPGLLAQDLDLVWTKYLARRGFNEVTDWAARLFSQGEMTPPLLAQIRGRIEAIEAEASRHTAAPKHLRQPKDFGEEFYNQFFGGREEEPGEALPIDFKLKIRPGETTLVTGDDGAGKSTVLGYFALHLAAAGRKCCLASFEMPAPVTLWILASQLLAAKRQPDAEVGRQRVLRSLAWLQPRFLLYDFLGIGDWRDVLDTFRYAAQKLGATVFVLDSVMRIGIPDDDYATQGLAAARFAQFAKENNAHLFYVIHENKGDGKGKARIRGSKLWSANADNVLRIERNESKGDKIDKLGRQLDAENAQAQVDANEVSRLDQACREARQEWDTHLVLQKQRFPGTRQNAGKWIYFDPENFQFRNQFSEAATVWLERWSASKPLLPNENNEKETERP